MVSVFAQGFLDDVDVVVDSREDAANPFFREYLSRKGMRVSVAKLEEGDFAIPASPSCRPVLVERKTVDDLISSIADGRVWSQLERLEAVAKAAGVEAYLVVEGDFLSALARRGLHPNAFMGFQEHVWRRASVALLFSPGKVETAEWLAKKCREAREEEAPERGAPPAGAARLALSYQAKYPRTSVNERILAVASVLAGREIGLRLLEKFGCLKNVANASIAELKEVKGVGDARAREIFLVFNKRIDVSEARRSSRKEEGGGAPW